MSIIIEGVNVKAPKSCMECGYLGGLLAELGADCPLARPDGDRSGTLIAIERLAGCPIRNIPEGHGEIKDVGPIIEQLEKVKEYYLFQGAIERCIDIVDRAEPLFYEEDDV